MPKTSNHVRLLEIFAYSVGLAGSVAGMECLFEVFDGASGSGSSVIFRGVELFACSFGVFSVFLIVLGKWHSRSISSQERTASEGTDVHEAEMRIAKARQLLSAVPKLTELLGSHLGETNRIGGESALSVLEQISSVQREASNLLTSLADARTEAASMRKHADALISSSRRKLDELEADNILRERAIRDGNAAIERTVVLMQALTSLTSTIGMLSKRTRLIAFNAGIRATNDSAIGRGFVAVADEMRKLAVQVESASNRIDDVMGRISETVKDKLVGMASLDLIETERDRMRTLAESMTRMSLAFEASVSRLDRLSTHLHGAVETIFAATLKTQKLSQSQDVSRQQIDLVRGGLTLCGDRLGRAADAMSIGSDMESTMLDDVLRTLEGKYTMRAQRTVHDRIVLGTIEGSPATRSTIELF